MDKFLAFLRRLDDGAIHYMLSSDRDDAVTVHVTASGDERWEVEFFADGRVEVERFRNDDGGVEEGTDALLETLFAED